ncbi:MAG: DinB family protein [Candidatus Solibacter usitatus]|nr:DinB family protein [Candidatus Solibacter usitatus]
MRTILLVSSLLITATGFAQPLTHDERERALSELHAGRKLLLDAVAGLSEAQWNFKPAPDRWSVAEVAEHITLAEDFLFNASQQILTSPATPEKKAEVQGKDELVLTKTLDRSRKGTAPEPLVPSHKWASHQEMIEQYKKSRDRAISYVASTQDELRSHFYKHPAFDLLDAYQWLLFMAVHSERHILQLKEVKADPNFPKM